MKKLHKSWGSNEQKSWSFLELFDHPSQIFHFCFEFNFLTQNNKFHWLCLSGGHHSFLFDQGFPKNAQLQRYLMIFFIDDIVPDFLAQYKAFLEIEEK